MSKATMSKITIIRDTREKKGIWEFERNDFVECTTPRSLKTGDYTIAGLEDILSIERKRNTGEVYNNLFEKRFFDELERLSLFKHKYIICEFTPQDIVNFPRFSNIPPMFHDGLKANGNYIMSRLSQIMVKYGIPIIYAGVCGKETCLSLIKAIARQEGLIPKSA